MDHGSGARRSALALRLLTCFALTAALSAPLSAFANTAPPPTPPPAQPAPVEPAIPAPPADRPIRIGVGRGLNGAEITASGGLWVLSGGKVAADLTAGQVAIFRLAGNQITLDGVTGPLALPIRVVPKPGEKPNWVSFTRKTYRGEFEVIIQPTGKLAVVNLINLEEYLLGVVPAEMPRDWPLEAYKAQAVAARTYAVANMGKQMREQGFDLTDTVADQAYGGVNQERPATTQAVQATAGQVITHKGQLIPTYYHSSSGGHTENNENVWNGAPREYLRGVVDYDNLPGNQRYSWSFRFTVDEFTQKLKAATFDVGDVKAVTPSPTVGPSGRPVHWMVQGSSRSVTLTGQQMRNALGLPSATRLLQFQMGGYGPTTRFFTPQSTVQVMGASRTVAAKPVAGLSVLGVGGAAKPTGMAVVAVGPAAIQQPGVEVVGGGFGHAVGLSQWGAHGMALLGKNHVEILTHYYQGTKVETR